MSKYRKEQLERWAAKPSWQAGRPDMATLVDGVPSKWVYQGDTYVAVASGRASDDWQVVMDNAEMIAAGPAMAAAMLMLGARIEQLEHENFGLKAQITMLEVKPNYQGGGKCPI